MRSRCSLITHHSSPTGPLTPDTNGLLSNDGSYQLGVPVKTSTPRRGDHHVDLAGGDLEVRRLDDRQGALDVAAAREVGDDVEVQDLQTTEASQRVRQVTELTSTRAVLEQLVGGDDGVVDVAKSRRRLKVAIRVGSQEVVLEDDVDLYLSQVLADRDGREDGRD